MAKFRTQLSLWKGSWRNGKRVSGYLSVDPTGEISVWNIGGTQPLGTIGQLVDCQVNHKQVTYKTKAGDEIVLSIHRRADADTFYSLISAKPPPADPVPADQSWTGLIQKLANLRDAGLLTEDEFAAKKAKVLRRI
jgi:Short C-terminal domain